MKEGNPQHILERGENVLLPPTLIIQGTRDDNVPLSIPQRFETAFRAAGGDIQVEYFPEQVHGFGNMPGPESDRAIGVNQGLHRPLPRPGRRPGLELPLQVGVWDR